MLSFSSLSFHFIIVCIQKYLLGRPEEPMHILKSWWSYSNLNNYSNSRWIDRFSMEGTKKYFKNPKTSLLLYISTDLVKDSSCVSLSLACSLVFRFCLHTFNMYAFVLFLFLLIFDFSFWIYNKGWMRTEQYN